MSGAVRHADWMRGGRFAPYVTSYAVAAGVISMMESAQPAGDMSDAPTSDLILIEAVSDGIRQSSDFGAGRFSETSPAGVFFLVPPYVATEIEVANPHVVRVFGLPERECRVLLENGHTDRPLDFGVLHRSGFCSDVLRALTRRLWSHGGGDDPVARLLGEGAMLTILGELSLLSGGQARQGPRSPACDWRIRRTLAHLESRLGDDIGLSELAAEVDLRPRHYTTLFRTATGLPPHAWVMKRRIERACELLCDPRRAITDIAVDLGFASSQHFATVFRKHMGMTPTDYRRERLS